MRRWLWLPCLATVLALVAPAASEEPRGGEQGPSLEYRPPRKVLPEPRQPTPAPPVTVFRETLGSFGIGAGSFDRPVDVAIDRDGFLYVLDSGNSRVQVFDRDSTYQFSWGSYGTLAGEFKSPSAIALDEGGFVYVVDSGNDRIQKFSVNRGRKAAEYLQSIGGTGSAAGFFRNPRDMAFDRDGNLWVVDAGNDRVQRFSASGVTEWGKYGGDRQGVFTGLVSIAFSDEHGGHIYLLSARCLVQKFTMEGVLRASWSAAAPDSGLCVPAQLETDNTNFYVYALDAGNGLFLRFSRDGQFLAALRAAERTFNKPLGFGLSLDRRDVAVADTGNNIVQKFTLR